MGSPITRKSILGGYCADRHYEKLGFPLNHLIDTFVSVAGANRGLFLCNSILANAFPVCNSVTGLKYSSAFIYSRQDDVVGLQCPNATSLCSPIPGSDDVKVVSLYFWPCLLDTAKQCIRIRENNTTV